MNYFVSITKKNDQPWLEINGREDGMVFFPLTVKGCRDAGKYLYESGQMSWSCSSSVDFPREIKPSFRRDVRELILEGYGSYKPSIEPSIDYRKGGDEVQAAWFAFKAVDASATVVSFVAGWNAA